MRFRFTIRDLLWLNVTVAVCTTVCHTAVTARENARNQQLEDRLINRSVAVRQLVN